MAKFRNRSGVIQVLSLPSVHFVKNESGIFWNDAPRKILEPDEILETSNENDVAYLRALTAERLVRYRGERKKEPGFLIEIER
jgi:hypothetical protein